MKAVSPTFTAIVAVIVAIVVVGAAVYTYQQFLAYSSQTTSSVSTTSTTPKNTLPYDATNKTVFITLVTLSSGSTFNFNGTSFGAMVIYVPSGWNIYLKYINQQTLPHNLVLLANDTPTPNSADIASDGKILLTVGTTSSAYQTSGIMSGQSAGGLYANISAGVYWLCCGIAGHAESGMWVLLVVSPNVTTPYVVTSSS